MKKGYQNSTKEQQIQLDNPPQVPELQIQTLITLQRMMLNIFETNNFNSNPIYWYNDLTPIGNSLKILYIYIMKYGLDHNIISNEEYEESQKILESTINENKWM